MNKTRAYASLLKAEAYRLGFEFVGISKAEFLEEEAPRLESWLQQGRHGKMKYMENHFDKRLDPRKLVEGARSVVTLLYNYYPEEKQHDPAAPKIAKYAYGEDYHFVIKDKLRMLMAYLEREIGSISGRAFVDSAPVMERAWARKSGAGWIGKNSLLLRKGQGSYSFLAELIIDLELEADGPVKDYCGTCTRCMDACPTGAIYEAYKVDARRCISYLTIELRDKEIPESLEGQMENWAFGCDICQDVCPWNRFASPHNEARFKAAEGMLEMPAEEWFEISKDVFNGLFKKSALKRSGYKGLKRNLEFLRRSRK